MRERARKGADRASEHAEETERAWERARKEISREVDRQEMLESAGNAGTPRYGQNSGILSGFSGEADQAATAKAKDADLLAHLLEER